MDLFNYCKLTSSPETSQVKHVGSSPDAILDQNQEHAKTLLVTPTDEKNMSSRPIGHNKYNYGKKNHKNHLAQLFDSSNNFSTQDLPVVLPFPFLLPITPRASLLSQER